MYKYLNIMSFINDTIVTVSVILLIGAVIYFSSKLAKTFKN